MVQLEHAVAKIERLVPQGPHSSADRTCYFRARTYDCRLARGGYAENLSIGRDPRTNRDPGRPRHRTLGAGRSCARLACRGQGVRATLVLALRAVCPDRSTGASAISSRVTRSPRGRWSPRPGCCCEEVGGPPAGLLGSCPTARRAFPTPLAGSLGLELDRHRHVACRPRVSDGIGGGLRARAA